MTDVVSSTPSRRWVTTPSSARTKPSVAIRAMTRNGYDIVLKKEDTKLRGDIGFQRGEDGYYTVGMDSYIIRQFTPEQFVKKVQGEYTVAKARATAETLGLSLIGKQDRKS